MRVFLLLSCAMLAGCFYTEQINQRPSIDIVPASDQLVYRDTDVTLAAKADDPEGHFVSYQWRLYLCSDATRGPGGAHPAGCDGAPFHTEVLPSTTFKVPRVRNDQPDPVRAVLVILEAKDAFGAVARPHDELIIPIADYLPELTLSMTPRYGYLVDTPIDLFAKVKDVDDGAENVTLAWKVFSPATQPSHDLVAFDVADPEAPTFLQSGQRFIPKGVGTWEVQVTATDPFDPENPEHATQKSLIINVVPDGAPCLSQWAPIAAPAGNTWPLTEATLFQVTVVTDDLDPYPTVPGDASLGTTKFSWKILQPGGAWQTLGITSNQASLDPANYAPGDIVELRVEIQDRKATTITCADNLATCSVISDNQCIQRLTWRVEVR